MACQRIIFPAFQGIQSIVVTFTAKKQLRLFPQLLLHKSLSQLELNDFHVFWPVKHPVRITRFHENAQTSETDSDDDREQQTNTNESKDCEDHLSQRNVRARLVPGNLGFVIDPVENCRRNRSIA